MDNKDQIGNRLRGLDSRVVNQTTVHVPLPRDLWVEINGGCCCRYCSATARVAAPAYWDTLALPAAGGATWLCHVPEYQGVQAKRSKS